MTEPRAISIEAREARVDVAGAVACEGLSFAVQGARVVITGTTAGAFAAALCGTGHLAAGVLLVDGRDVGKAEHFGHVGVAPFDMPLPQRDSVLAFVTVSFRLSGHSRLDAAAAAHGMLDALGLHGLETRKAPSLSAPERRAVAIAQAMLPGASVLFAETPLAGLETQDARYVLEVLGKASAQRAVVATTLRTDAASAERELVLGADTVAMLDAAGATFVGAPESLLSGARLFVVTVRGHEDRFEQAARAAGLTLSGAAPRFVLHLEQGTGTDLVLQLAREAESTVLELAPIWD